MKNTALRFPVPQDPLPPPPALSMDDYYAFVCLAAGNRGPVAPREDDLRDEAPRFQLVDPSSRPPCG